MDWICIPLTSQSIQATCDTQTRHPTLFILVRFTPFLQLVYSHAKFVECCDDIPYGDLVATCVGGVVDCGGSEEGDVSFEESGEREVGGDGGGCESVGSEDVRDGEGDEMGWLSERSEGGWVMGHGGGVRGGVVVVTPS